MRHAHPPVVDKFVNEEKVPAANVVFVVEPPVGIVELEIVEPFEEEEDVGEESIGSLEFIPLLIRRWRNISWWGGVRRWRYVSWSCAIRWWWAIDWI